MTDDRLSATRRRYLLGLGAGAIGTTGVAGSASAQTTTAGEEIWAFQTGSYVSSSPTVVDGTVYVGSLDGNLYAVDGATGNQEWAFQTDRRVTSSPTVVDGTVYVGSDNDNLYAVDAATGEQEWTFQTGGGVDSSPTVADGTVYLGSKDKNLYAVDAGVSGSSEDSRVMLGTLGHHGDWSYADQSISISTGGTTDDQSLPLIPVGLGTAAAGVTGLAALRRYGGSDDGPDTRSESTPSESHTSANTSPSTESPDVDIDGRLEEIDSRLDSARQARDAGEYERALTACSRAIDDADELRPAAAEHLSERLDDIDARRDEAESLQDAIESARDATREVRQTLENVSATVDSVAESIDEDPQNALDRLDEADDTLDSVTPLLNAHDFSGGESRQADLQTRIENLRDRATAIVNRHRVPQQVPTTPRHSLTYDAIEKGDPLGGGGNADVYYATTDTDDGQIELAIKEPRMSGTLHTETVDRMLEEAETWQRLDDHDHIVSVVDYGAEPLPWIAMEYMDGGHLGERGSEMDLKQALWTAIATTKAVRHAHRRGVAHLDLKPENILFRTTGGKSWDVPKVADWGLSKHLLEHSKSVEGMSPHYAAPEQFDEDFGPTDDVTDVYQLGAVFYELFTGRPPFEGRPTKVMRAVMDDEPPAPSEVADVPGALDAVLLQALAKDKGDRYESVLYLRDDLQDLFDDLA